VSLVAVDEEVLEELVRVATNDAAADDVTPRLDPTEEWTPDRVAWLRSFHRGCRSGLDGPAGEATWAIVVGTQVIGSIRLKRTDEDGVLETGIWLTRSARGHGAGLAAVDAVLRKAADVGAAAVAADTTARNKAALAVLRRLGFTIGKVDSQGNVAARLRLAPDPTVQDR
jgi:RimJ/RimL family protein N-acetyltransferase